MDLYWHIPRLLRPLGLPLHGPPITAGPVSPHRLTLVMRPVLVNTCATTSLANIAARWWSTKFFLSATSMTSSSFSRPSTAPSVQSSASRQSRKSSARQSAGNPALGPSRVPLIWFDLIWYDLSRFFDFIFIWFDFDRARAAELNRFNSDLI